MNVAPLHNLGSLEIAQLLMVIAFPSHVKNMNFHRILECRSWTFLSAQIEHLLVAPRLAPHRYSGGLNGRWQVGLGVLKWARRVQMEIPSD